MLFLGCPLFLEHGEMQVGDLVGNNNNHRADLMFVQQNFRIRVSTIAIEYKLPAKQGKV